MNDRPFDTIESALEFLALFETVIDETTRDIKGDIAVQQQDPRQVDALRLVAFKLEKLQFHITCSKRMANDLRTLRRLLFQERQSTSKAQGAMT
jgi:hypothetical protein